MDTLHLGSLVILYQKKFTIQQQRCSGGGEETNYLHYINEKYLNLHNSLWQSISCEYWVKPLWRVPETSKEWRNPLFNFQKRIRIGGTRNNEQWQSDPQLKAAVSGLHERKTRGELEPRTQQAPPPLLSYRSMIGPPLPCDMQILAKNALLSVFAYLDI